MRFHQLISYHQSLYVVNVPTIMPSWQLLLVFMAFAGCLYLVLSANPIRKHPYWAGYLTNPHALQVTHYIASPIEVLPGHLFENYTKLKVGNNCCDINNVDTFLITNNVWPGGTRYLQRIHNSRNAVISRGLDRHFE